MKHFLALPLAALVALNCCLENAMAQEAALSPTALPHKSASIVVDAQVGILGPAWGSARLVANIEELVRKARKAGAPVLWAQHSDQELKYGSDNWKLAENFAPELSEPIVHNCPTP